MSDEATRNKALDRLRNITEGIDSTESECDYGWWETSTGAEFGKRTLGQLEQLIIDITQGE